MYKYIKVEHHNMVLNGLSAITNILVMSPILHSLLVIWLVVLLEQVQKWVHIKQEKAIQIYYLTQLIKYFYLLKLQLQMF
jgi:hypothetical protein